MHSALLVRALNFQRPVSLRRHAWAAVLLWLLLAPTNAVAQSKADPETAGRRQHPAAESTARSAVAPLAMAVTANPHATRAAVEVLRAGGNAVDAALAAQFVLNVVEPQSSGIGGGGFMLVYVAATGAVEALDGREEAPAAVTPRLFLGPDGAPLPFYPERITGGRAVGVPGLPALLELARQRHGSWPLARLLEPARLLAREGFPVSPRLAESLEQHKVRLGRFPATRAVFFGTGTAGHGGDLPLREGELLRQPDLARAFRLLARDGMGVFYQGEIARAVVDAVRQAPVAPGLLSAEDLASYRAVRRAPVRGSYRGHDVYGMGPPSSGGVTLIQMLQLLETQPTAPGATLPSAPDVAAIHRFVQAALPAYADRARYLADPDFTDVPVAGLLSPGYAQRRAAEIDWAGPLRPVQAGLPPGAHAMPGRDTSREMPGTTHLVVADAQGNVVALTSSVEQAFGSAMVVPGWGFLLNNQLTDFSAKPVDEDGNPIANAVEGGRSARRTALDGSDLLGGKRPRSSMAPTLVLREGRVVLALGSPGGSRIIQYVAEVLVRVLDGGMGLQDAVSAPHHTHLGGRTDLEPALAEAPGLQDGLRALGHQVRAQAQNSGIHAIAFERAADGSLRVLQGVADHRREGVAEGY